MPREPDHQTTVVPEVCGPEVLGVGERCLDVGPDGVVRLAGEVRPSIGDAVFPHFSRRLAHLLAGRLQESFSPDVVAEGLLVLQNFEWSSGVDVREKSNQVLQGGDGRVGQFTQQMPRFAIHLL